MKLRTRCCAAVMAVPIVAGIGVSPVVAPQPQIPAVFAQATAQVKLAATILIIPGTKPSNAAATQPPTVPVKTLLRELDGYISDQRHNPNGSVDPVVVIGYGDEYPGSAGPFTGVGDPSMNYSMYQGVRATRAYITNWHGGDLVIFGYSQGAAIGTSIIRGLKDGTIENPPTNQQLTFVFLGNPNRGNGGLFARAPGLWVPIVGVTFDGATPSSTGGYKVLDVTRQYDPFSDFPVDPLNVLALVNLFCEPALIHANYLGVNINDPANRKEVVGDTTYVFEYAKSLPLANSMVPGARRLFGDQGERLVRSLEPLLRVLVESGYAREVSQGTPTVFQPGSSVVRLVRSLPQVVTAIKDGVRIWKTWTPKNPPSTNPSSPEPKVGHTGRDTAAPVNPTQPVSDEPAPTNGTGMSRRPAAPVRKITVGGAKASKPSAPKPKSNASSSHSSTGHSARGHK